MAFKRYDTIFDKIGYDLAEQEKINYDYRDGEGDIIDID